MRKSPSFFRTAAIRSWTPPAGGYGRGAVSGPGGAAHRPWRRRADPRYIDIFKLKYDYHNAKAILKAAAMGTSPDRMLMDMGRIGAAELKTAVESGELDKLPGALPAAVAEAKSVLDTTRDPQLSDIVLDRWMYRDMAQVAEDTGSQFLRGYVETQIDAANLRALIRTLRWEKTPIFWRAFSLRAAPWNRRRSWRRRITPLAV